MIARVSFRSLYVFIHISFLRGKGSYLNRAPGWEESTTTSSSLLLGNATIILINNFFWISAPSLHQQYGQINWFLLQDPPPPKKYNKVGLGVEFGITGEEHIYPPFSLMRRRHTPEYFWNGLQRIWRKPLTCIEFIYTHIVLRHGFFWEVDPLKITGNLPTLPKIHFWFVLPPATNVLLFLYEESSSSW